MTENDYIAEYVKERHPGILGFDFAVWRLGKKIIEIGKDMATIFSSDEFKQALLEQESEGNHEN